MLLCARIIINTANNSFELKQSSMRTNLTLFRITDIFLLMPRKFLNENIKKATILV